MSGILPAYAFTDTDKADIRRYAGYPPYGTGVVTFIERFTRIYLNMEARLVSLTATEATIIQTYLTNLRQLESDIPAVRANLDTDAAAVWTHNKNELADRLGLYNQMRLFLCQAVGVLPGPYLKSGIRLVV